MGSKLLPEFIHQPPDVAAAAVLQDLKQLRYWSSFAAHGLEMLEQQLLFSFAIQSLFPRMQASLSQEAIKLARQNNLAMA